MREAGHCPSLPGETQPCEWACVLVCTHPPHPLTSSPVDGSFHLLRAEREELAKEMWEKEKAKERVKVSNGHQTTILSDSEVGYMIISLLCTQLLGFLLLHSGLSGNTIC